MALTLAGRDLKARARRVQVDVERATGLGPESVAALREELHGLAAELRGESGELTA